MNRRAAVAGVRPPAAQAGSLLALALMAAAPAWAQQAPPSSDGAPAPDAAEASAPSAPANDAPAVNVAPPPEVMPVAHDPAAADVTTPPAANAPAAPPAAEDTPATPPSDTAPPSPIPPTEAGASAPAAPTDGTAAEADFNALYGPGNTGAPTAPAQAYDPWEPYNRRMHRFNNGVDRHVAKPLARAYVKAVPRPVRSGVSNFFSNLGQPLTAINSLLQGKPRQAAHSVGRFLLNSTVGVAGVFDPATRVGLENANEDFGQTLGVWGWKRSRYVELPFFGPRTLRDVLGMVGDAPLSPLRQVEADRVRVPLQGMQLVDLRAQLMSTDALREGAEDDYTLVRDAWMQRRAYQIDGDASQGDGTPDYLKDDPGLVPVNAMPVMPPSGG